MRFTQLLLLQNLFPGENQDMFVKCTLCHHNIAMKNLTTHIKHCQEKKGKENKSLKEEKKYGPLPPLMNQFDDVLRSSGRSLFKKLDNKKVRKRKVLHPPTKEPSEASNKKSSKSLTKECSKSKPSLKEPIKMTIRGFASRYSQCMYYSIRGWLIDKNNCFLI